MYLCSHDMLSRMECKSSGVMCLLCTSNMFYTQRPFSLIYFFIEFTIFYSGTPLYIDVYSNVRLLPSSCVSVVCFYTFQEKRRGDVSPC